MSLHSLSSRFDLSMLTVTGKETGFVYGEEDLAVGQPSVE